MSETKQPGRQGVTFEQVAAVANALLAEDRRPSLRAVRERLGSGSMGTIQRHLAAWDAARPKVHAAEIELSPSIRREIEDEIQRHMAEATGELREQLADVVSARDALAEEAEMQATTLAELEQQRDQLQATVTEQAARIEELRTAEERERTAAEQARVALAEANLRLQGIPALEAELERLRTALEARTAELSRESARAASVTADRDALVRQLTSVEQRATATETHIERLQGELLVERERAGKAEARAEGIATRVTDLQAQMKTAAESASARLADAQEQLKMTAAREAEAVRRADAAEQHAREAVLQGVREQK